MMNMISVTSAPDREELEHALHDAISSGALSVHYQPRFRSLSGTVETLEALVRWNHPVYGMIMPGEFIHIAEEQGLICRLGLWVLERCCRDYESLQQRFDGPVRIAVNVSLMQCDDIMHAQKIFDTCNRFGCDLGNFEFELTETTEGDNRKNVINFCETLSALGAEISLDDFGTGYSPLSNLFDLPISCIKVDRRFTAMLGKDMRGRILIEHLIGMAHKLKMKVVAEGVETIYQRDLLIDMGCDQIQGFLMGKPFCLDQI